ncbi:hypothetical protein GE061_006217 [Apolygus lucorum]|uniref:MADF domain-containing protein n=1 Tax=Apolygus lucorum TaxID=248454 RepID=A0A8S9WUN3_APOLU|nr:hypothetical protein GE061_006217 [Apolygus lucorum]
MQSSSSKSTINLINNVRKRPFLYDQDSPNYRDVETRTQAWDEIGKELKIGAGEARLAWDKLRRCFSNALNRRRQQTSRARKSWRYHKYMEFLEPHVDCKKLPPPAVEDFLEVNIQEESVGEEADESSPADVISIKQEPVDAEEILSSLVDVDEEQVSEAEKEPLRVQYPKNFKTSNFGPPKRRKTRGFDYVDRIKTSKLKTKSYHAAADDAERNALHLQRCFRELNIQLEPFKRMRSAIPLQANDQSRTT